ncbi:MAG: MFS transporter [Desulfovibrio sp.]|jgi:DHA1 family bicyclomycin/chloramphenicol resistance-like MFS transporter|nr:MFS transporter [Desulfovibrio sp.]
MTSQEYRPFRFGRLPFIVYLAFLSAFVPLSTDFYLAALPGMTDVFNCPRWLVDLTISGFMLFFALSMLVWGPLSDRCGRRPTLRAGLALYAAASVLCLVSQNIHMLVAGRLLQAIGSGAVCSVSMAIVKDVFRGRAVETVLVWMQTMSTLAPVLAPVFGAALLTLTSWRGLFAGLLLCSLAGLAPLPALKETLTEPTKGGWTDALKRIGVVLRNPALRLLLLLFSISVMPFMAYLTSSSFIYIRFFGLSERSFSLFFAANALCSMLGPLAYVRFFRHMSRRAFISLVFAATTASGLGLLAVGENGPWHFLLLYLPLTFFSSAVRPVATLLMLFQQDTDNGTVSALIGCGGLVCGSLAMMICSLPFSGPVLPVAGMAAIIGAVCLVMWLTLDGKKLYRAP